VKSITLSVPDETYRQARIRAAENGTSVSAMVAAYLRSLGDANAEFDRLAALQRRTMATITQFSARDRLDREVVHDRALR
jgi:plasmid stability protein